METPLHADPVVRLTDVRKTYGRKRNSMTALDGVTVGFARASFTAVMGPSGSGKTTFLHCAAGLDRPTSGTVQLEEQNLGELSEAELTRLRREQIGFIFQSFNLMPALTVQENVTLPLRLSRRRASRGTVEEVLEQVGLAEQRRRLPGELSGGQQQRVAVARALITRPAVMFADEPTGALDPRSARDVLGLLRAAVSSDGRTVVMVTHDPVAASYADRVVFLAEGRLTGELADPTVETVAEWMTHLGAWADDPPGPQHVAPTGAV